MTRRILGLAILLAIATTLARGGVTLELIDRGVPTDGMTTATGYRGYTVRLISDEARFAALDFDSTPWGIFGPLVQTWTSSGEDGIYDSPTPAFFEAQNLTPSRMNFDSHYLPPGGQMLTPPIWPNEDATIGPPGSQFATFPANTSGYGTGLGNRLAIVHAFQGGGSTAFDLAYVVVPDGEAPVVRGGIARVGMPLFVVNSAPTWSGGQNDLWNSAPSNTNWTFWGKPVAFKAGNDVQFIDTSASSDHTVQMDAAGVAPRHIDMNISGKYAFSGGRITSNGRLRKEGNGSVTFNTPVTLAGNAEFYNGSVWINSDFRAAGTAFFQGASLWINSELTAGSTWFASGSLGGNGTITGGVRLELGMTIVPGAAGVVGTLSVGRITSLPSSSLVWSMDVTSAGADRINVTGPNGIATALGGTLKLNRIGNLAAGTFTLIDYAGDPLPDLGRLRLAEPAISGLAARLVHNTTNRSIDLVLSTGPQWNIDADGSWSNAACWSESVSDGVWIPVTFGPAITAPRTVWVDGHYAVGSLLFDSPVSYDLRPSFPIVGDLNLITTSDSDQATIDVLRGNHFINTPIESSSKTRMTIAAGASLEIDRLDGKAAVIKSGTGTLKLVEPYLFNGAATVEAGTLIVQRRAGGTGSFTVRNGATLAGTGTLASVILEPGSRLAPGDENSQTMIVRKLSIDSALLDFDLTSSGTDKLVVTVANQFLLKGISDLSVTVADSITPGIYTLIDYNGTPLTDFSHLVLNSPPGSKFGLEYNSANTSIDLLVSETFTPEPGAIMALLLLAALSRRRWQSCT
jgi:hypothetical protein